jgi:predicted NAD/FAD-dependent oxidoreductase
MSVGKVQRVAVIGAGIAGASCARALSLAGHAVQVFDKSGGPGGRLATRRAEWVDESGQVCSTPLDHGAVGITAWSEPFLAFVDQAVQLGWLAEWSPTLAPNSLPLEGASRLRVPVPDMPSLCRRLLEGTATTWSFAVDALYNSPSGWQVQAGVERYGARFDAVVLALPPAQAAPLLSAHREDWARQASLATMQPCWTLMGAARLADDDLAQAPGWDLDRPPEGPLAWVIRNDSRPGRARVPGQAHWVVHARPGWSRGHLEQSPAWVQRQMQSALDEHLGRPIDWLHSTVHRWRYALPPTQRPASAESSWWDPARGLGVCGDFLGGGGIEGAWLSGQSVSAALLQQGADAAHQAGPAAVHRQLA